MPHNAGIAQLVEHNLAKVGVASSSLVSRSKMTSIASLFSPGKRLFVFLFYLKRENPHPLHPDFCYTQLRVTFVL